MALIFGYTFNDVGITTEEKNASIVKLVFDMYTEGNSYLQIADYLNENKLRVKNKAWNKNKIGRILDNKKYCGTEEYPAIISKDTFNAVQKIRQANNGYLRVNPQIEIVKSKAICCECYEKYIRYNSHGKYRWTCNNKNCKTLVRLTDEEILELVELKIDKLKSDDSMLNSLIMSDRKKRVIEETKEISAIRNALDLEFGKNDVQIERIFNLLENLVQVKFQQNSSYMIDKTAKEVQVEVNKYKESKDFSEILLTKMVRNILIGKNGDLYLRLADGIVV